MKGWLGRRGTDVPSIRSTSFKHICWAPPQGNRGKVAREEVRFAIHPPMPD